MTVTVYVWLPRSGSVGHASMTLGNGTHISLWPSGEKRVMMSEVKGVKRGSGIGSGGQYVKETTDSVEEDLEIKGYEYDCEFHIDGLVEDAIQTWWNNFTEKWDLLSQNCCKTVINGLRAGGSERKLDRVAWLRLNWKMCVVLSLLYTPIVTLVWTPVWVQRYCSLLD